MADEQKDKLASIKSNEELLSQMDKLLNVTKDYSNLVKDVNKRLTDLKDPYLKANKLAENLAETTVDLKGAQMDLLKSEQLLNVERKKFDKVLKDRGITEQELSDQIKQNYETEKALLDQRENEQKNLQQSLLELQSSMMAKMQTLETEHLDLVVGLEAQIQQVRIKAAQDRFAIANGSAQDLQQIEVNMMQDVERIQGQIRESNRRLHSELILEKEYAESEKLRLERESKDKIMQLDEQLMQNRQKIKDLEPLELAQKEYQVKLETVGLDRDRLKTEEMVNQQLGFSGKMAQKLAEKLGFGQVAQAAMTLEARNMVNENGKVVKGFAGMKAVVSGMSKGLSSSLAALGPMGIAAGAVGLGLSAAKMAGNALGGALSKGGSMMKGLSEESSDFVSGLTSGISDMAKNIPIVGGLFAGLIDFAAGFLDLIIGVDDYIVRTGRQLGLTAEKSRALTENFKSMAANSSKTFVNTKALTDSFAAMAKATGLNNQYTQEALETNIELTKYAGLQAETTAELANIARINGTTMKGVTKEVLTQVVALEQSTGIAFNYQEVLKEAAGFSGRLGLSFAKYPKELSKSLLMTKAMGLDLKELNSMASSFLDFESSISKEFEAQLLTGKEINLAKARELFMNNDLAGAAAEITKQVGDANSFLKMNRFQQDALAESMGMSADQMADMLKKQELFAKFGVTNQQGLLKQIDLMRSQNKEAEIKAKFQDDEAYRSMVNLSLQDKLMTSFEKIKQSLVDFITQPNVIDKIQGFVNYLSDPKNIQNIVDNVKGYIVKIMDFVGGAIALILEAVGNIANFFTFGDKGDRIEKQFDLYAAQVRDFSETFSESFKKTEAAKATTTATSEDKKAAPEDQKITKSVKDAVIFPGNNMVINKDPLDYTIFTKNPSSLLQGGDYSSLVSAIASAIKQQPINLNLKTDVAVQGEPIARANYTAMKNNLVTGFDRQSGPMSANS